MQTKHTPGPWTIKKSTRTDHHIIAGRRWIATASNHDFHPTQEENERTIANARLISAAPDLLAALDKLLSATVDRTLAEGYEMDGVEYAARSAALAAIAKATGGQA